MNLSIYHHPTWYKIVMRALYGRHERARYRAVAAAIPEAARVVDLCCGECELYARYLRHRGVDYLGLDSAEEMLRWGRARGARTQVVDLRHAPIPAADVVVMQASLYQFIPHHRDVLDRMLDAASLRVVISEPIENLSEHPNGPLQKLSRSLTTPVGDTTYTGARFDRSSFTELCLSFAEVERVIVAPGGRDMVATFKGRKRL